jgi:hypothetical protein
MVTMSTPTTALRRAFLAALLLAAAACGDGSSSSTPNPYAGTPPTSAAISRTEGTPIAGAPTWTWVPFQDAVCTDAVLDSSGLSYQFSSSATGLAISWGPETSTDVVVFLQGGGACWDFLSCGGIPNVIPKTASTGPFGPAEFAKDIYAKYPHSWVVRANLPSALADATIVFVPYCTGDVHGGDAVRTYTSPIQGLPPITWHHAGHANIMAFLKRLGPTFPSPGKLVVAGSSAGGFGSLANYPAFRWYWPNARAYLVDDSGPPLIGDAIPPANRNAWYASWNLGASLDAFCTTCRADLSDGIREIAHRYPSDRLALISHLQDLTIRTFFATIDETTLTVAVMPADRFQSALVNLKTTVMDPVGARCFYTNTPSPTAHPSLEDPTRVTTPAPGLAPWIELMLSDDPSWTSVSD